MDVTPEAPYTEPKQLDVLDGMDLGFWEKLELRLRIVETGYGCHEGWYLEEDGQRLALLTDPQYYDMFWISYRIEMLSQDPSEREAMLTSAAFWHERPHIFRNRRFGLVADHALAGGIPESGRIIMRALYLPVRLSLLLQFFLFWRGLFSKKHHCL